MVLIIDDHQDTLDMLQIALSMRHIPAVVAADRGIALLLLKQYGAIKCVLMDYNMPGMSPDEFVEASNRIPRPIQIALLTASSDIADHAHALGLRFWISKPVHDFDRLYKLVEDCENYGVQLPTNTKRYAHRAHLINP